jgi:hypothetical protein
MKKSFLLLLMIVYCQFLTAQTYIKGNAVLLPVGMFNGALETKINDKFTIQPEFFASPWKSFLDKRFHQRRRQILF